MRSSTLALLPLVVFAQVAPALALQEPAPDAAKASIVDEDYRFRLEQPDADWKLLGPKEIQSVQPEAVAGLLHPPDLYGIVIVLPAPDADLQAIARSRADKMPLTNKEFGRFETLQFQGRDAVRFVLTGDDTSGITYRHQVLLFENGGFVYQLASWGRREFAKADGSTFQPFLDSFTLLAGEVHRRIDVVVPRDTSGPGWRLRGGVYQNAALGVEVRPHGAWTVHAGKDLEMKGGDSQVEITSSDPPATIALLVDRITGLDPRAYEAQFFVDREKEFVGISGTVDATLAGEPLAMRRFTARPNPDGSLPNARHLCGVRQRGDLCFQIYAWFPIGQEEAGTKAVLDGLSAIRFLGESERTALESELASDAEEPPDVGETWSVRNGTYRDFRHGFQWTRPTSSWQIRTGAAARRFSENTLVVLRDPALGVWGTVSAMPSVPADPNEYHRVVAESMFGPDSTGGHPLELDLGTIEGRASTAEPRGDESRSRYLLVTVLGASRRYHITFWGPSGVVEASADQISAAVRGFSLLPKELSPTTVDEGIFRDERLGFELARPGPKWSFAEMPSRQLGTAGSAGGWQNGERQLVVLAAMYGVRIPADDDILGWFASQYRLPIGMEEYFEPESQAESMTVLGLPARHVWWEGKDGRFDLVVFLHQQTFYSLGIASQRGEPTIERVLAGFRFLP